MKKKIKALCSNYYLKYTLVFCVISAVVFSWFYQEGKSFVFCDADTGGDGLVQHYNSLAYFGRYLREVVYNLLNNHVLEFPMWDAHMGYGSDIITTLSYYVIGDPLTLLAVFVPIEQTEWLYCGLIVLRFYLTGVAFSYFCRYHKSDEYATLIGAIAYAFCSFAMFAGVLHPYFLNPMIYFPLLLVGVDKIFNKERPFTFISMVFVSAISNFYFFYMIVILVVLYATFRYFELFRFSVKELFGWIGKFIGYAVVGVGMSCVIFLPTIMNLLSSNRVGGGQEIIRFYPEEYYGNFLSSFLLNSTGFYTYMGYCSVALLCVAALYLQKKKYVSLKIAFLMLVAFLLVPFMGHVFNGFSYVTNRWIWGLSFLVGIIIVKMIPKLFEMRGKELIKLIVFVCVYSGISIAVTKNFGTETRYHAYILLAIGVIVLLLTQYIGWLGKCRKALILIYCLCGIALNAHNLYSLERSDYLNKFTNAGEAYDMLMNSPGSLVKGKAKTFSRYDTTGIASGIVKRNASMLLRTNTTSFYFSTTNNYVSQFLEEHCLNTTMEQTIVNLDARTFLDSALGVSRYIVFEGNTMRAYGYDERVTQKNGFVMYKTNTSLPLAYTFDSYIDRETYEDLSVAKKQQAILQGAVIEEEYAGDLEETQTDFTDVEIPYEITLAGNIEQNDDEFIVRTADATMTLTLWGEKEAENYVVLNGFDYQPLTKEVMYTEKEWNSFSKKEKEEKEKILRTMESVTSSYVVIKGGDVAKSVGVRNEKDTYYSGRENYLCNLGFQEKNLKKITIRFPKTGVYTIEELQIVCQPMDNLEKQIKALKKDKMKQMKFGVNTVSGTISLEENKLLCFALPYSKGWKAKVDGKEVDVIQTNTMFMGLNLNSGEHEIELRYTTPYIIPGLIISCLSVVILILIIWYEQMKKKRVSVTEYSKMKLVEMESNEMESDEMESADSDLMETEVTESDLIKTETKKTE